MKWCEQSKHDQVCTDLASKARTIPGVWGREDYLWMFIFDSDWHNRIFAV